MLQFALIAALLVISHQLRRAAKDHRRQPQPPVEIRL